MVGNNPKAVEVAITKRKKHREMKSSNLPRIYQCNPLQIFLISHSYSPSPLRFYSIPFMDLMNVC